MIFAKPWTVRLYAEHVEKHAPLVHNVETAHRLWKDVFAGIFEGANAQRSKSAPEAGCEWLEAIMDEALELPEWKVLAKRVDGDPWAACYAVPGVITAIAGALPPAMPGALPVCSPLELEDRYNDLRAMEADGVNVSTALLPLANSLAAKAGLARVAELYRSVCVAQMSQIRTAIRAACVEAVKRLDEDETEERLLGGGGWDRRITTGSTPRDPSVASRRAASLWNDEKLKRVLAIAGRMERVAERTVSRRTDHNPCKVVGLELGNDPERVIPADMALFAEAGILNDLFFAKFAGKSLVQDKLEGFQPMGKGPIVMCVDVSASMEGDRDEWAKAIALVLARRAIEAGRGFFLSEFGEWNRAVFEAAPQLPAPASMRPTLRAWVKRNASDGGTEFEPPLGWAMAQIETNPTWEKADIVFITDGQCAVRHAFAENFGARKKRMQVRVQGIVIGGTGKSLMGLADDVVEVTNMTPDAAAPAFVV